MNRIAKLMFNDISNGDGVCVSIFIQGCPIRCPGCFNKQTWDFNGGNEIQDDFYSKIIKAISKNNIQRGLNILGGEPLCKENVGFTKQIIFNVKQAYPNIKIYLWSGYEIEQLQERAKEENDLKFILENITMIVCGPFIQEKKDMRLRYAGSTNQRVLRKGEDF